MSKPFANDQPWLRYDPKSVGHFEYSGHGRLLRYEENLPVLRGLNKAQRDAMAQQARPGESWEQLVVRLQREADAAAWAAIPPCRLCQSRDRYQSPASQSMGICDACNAELLAELGDPETDL